MSDQSYASLNDPYWISSRGTDKILWNKLNNPPLAALDKGITYELNDSRLYHNGNKLSYESETGTIQNGTTTKLSYYSDTNQISPSDMDYVGGNGIKRGASWLVKATLNRTSIGKYDVDLSRYVVIGGNAQGNYGTGVDESVIIGSQACFQSNNTFHSVVIGTNASFGSGTGPSNVTNSICIGWRPHFDLKNMFRSVTLGTTAYQSLTSGTDNINIDDNALGVTTESNTIRIGTVGTKTKCYIQGIRGSSPVVADGNVVEVSSQGQLTSSSSYVKGPANALDNTIVVYDQATGKLIKNSNILAVDRDITNVSNLETENTTITTGSLFLPDSTTNSVGTIRNSTGVLMRTSSTSYDMVLGYNSGNGALTTGIGNTILGTTSGTSLTLGQNNLIIGTSSGNNITSTNDNILIGNFITNPTTNTNCIYLGNSGVAAENNTIRIGGSQSSVYCDVINQKTPTEIRYVFIDSNGLLSSRTQLYRAHSEILYGDGGLSLASFVLTTQNVWYSIDSSNFQTGIFSQDNNNAKFLTPKFDDNGIPGNSRFLSTIPDKGHSSISLSMNTSNATNIYQVCILQNGTPIPATIVYFDFANNNSYESIAYHKLLNMSQNDVFSIGIRCTSTNNATVGLYNLDFFIMGMEQQF